MKPAPFAYVRPESLPQATAVLSQFGDEGKILAGGQSLLPLMNFRLARPEALVDIGGLGELSGIRIAGEQVTVGALTRHLDLEHCQLAGPLGSLIRSSAKHVGHLPIRTRGTFGGSVAHADPSAEWCMLTALLDGSVTAINTTGERHIAAQDFFETFLTTTLQPDELLTAVTLPLLGDKHRTAIVEFSRRAGDFAVVAVMVACTVDQGTLAEARVCFGGVADRPVRSPAAEAVLTGQPAGARLFADAADAAAQAVSPPDDIHGSSEYRRDLMRVLLRRALERMAA
jgi:aerobic carbon-monoxide dehydrogenase medium subunit